MLHRVAAFCFTQVTLTTLKIARDLHRARRGELTGSISSKVISQEGQIRADAASFRNFNSLIELGYPVFIWKQKTRSFGWSAFWQFTFIRDFLKRIPFFLRTSSLRSRRSFVLRCITYGDEAPRRRLTK